MRPDQVADMQARADALDRFARLFTQYQAGTLEPRELNALLVVAWRRAAVSLALPGVSKRDIVAMFRTAGFVTNRPGYAPPTEPMRVYRGATPAGVLGFSWTPRRDQAAVFACSAQREHGEGVMVETTVRSHQILGVLFQGQMALEVIINPLTLHHANLLTISADDQEIVAAAAAFERAQSTLRTILDVCVQGWDVRVPGTPAA